MSTPRVALVVAEDPATVDRWTAWLEHAGYVTFTCNGPHETGWCPRLHGERCPRREVADVAMVDVSLHGAELRTTEHRACTRMPDDGTTVFVSGRDEPTVHEDVLMAVPLTPAALIDAADQVTSHRSSTLLT